MADQEAVVEVYWRAGCPFCFRLRQALFLARVPVAWHDIWSDQRSAAFVRSVADGNETVPTVVLDGKAYVNPSPGKLLAMIKQAHPDVRRLSSPLAAARAFWRSKSIRRADG
jgi:glutaredoxin